MTYEYKAYPKFLYNKDGNSVLIQSKDETPEGDWRDSPTSFDDDIIPPEVPPVVVSPVVTLVKPTKGKKV